MDQSESDDRHEFGGPWTEVKLDALQSYSSFFTTALKKQNFELWYIDAFAGTGSRTVKRETGGLLDGAPLEIVEETLDGSAKRALAVQPPFHHLVFMDQRPAHYTALTNLTAAEANRDIRVFKGDANDILQSVFSGPPWAQSREASRQRAIVFLDPYGINVTFETLKLLARTERADVWYLVNLKGVVQQLAHDHSRLDDGKRRALSEFFGSEDWEQQFYSFQEAGTDLFNQPTARSGARSITREEVAAFYRAQLESIFRYVSPALGLAVRQHQDYFQLYCLSNNPRPQATALIKRGAEAVIKKHSPAFRRMSVL